ncbi:helix-turn-helix domain-containing protein [Algibacter lectus]|uniref:helix-turn-helix domain-containing protein n=1 Tax=Algibacter lectus TaxID=221126 RepID=UPI00187CC551
MFELLRVLRNEIAEKNDLIHYQVFNQKTLYEMCETLPLNKAELLEINGMGKTRVEKYGTDILKVIRGYCDENDIDTSADKIDFTEEKVAEKPKAPKVDTKKVSLDLFKSGKSIDEIEDERELTRTTILRHLSHFIDSGEVKISDLMPIEHYNELKKIIPKNKFESLTELKQLVDDKYTYEELRLVLRALNDA